MKRPSPSMPAAAAFPHTADVMLVFGGSDLTLGAVTTFVETDNHPYDLTFPPGPAQ